MSILLTNILQNQRKRISAKLLDGGTRHGHTLSQQHTTSGNHRPASEMPFKCFRCCIAIRKKERLRKGVGSATRLESPVETHSIFVVFLQVLLFFDGFGRGGGGKMLI